MRQIVSARIWSLLMVTPRSARTISSRIARGPLHVDEEVVVREEEAADVVVADDAAKLLEHGLGLHRAPRPLVHDRVPAEAAPEGAAAARVEADVVDAEEPAPVPVHVEEVVGERRLAIEIDERACGVPCVFPSRLKWTPAMPSSGRPSWSA
jgi:hypothetical protein